MSTEAWTQLVQRVDQLISELRTARAESKRWQARAAELERLSGRDDHTGALEAQAKTRELERYQRERKKIVASITRIMAELEKAQTQPGEREAHDH